jgi:hypothetical protein
MQTAAVSVVADLYTLQQGQYHSIQQARHPRGDRSEERVRLLFHFTSLSVTEHCLCSGGDPIAYPKRDEIPAEVATKSE